MLYEACKIASAELNLRKTATELDIAYTGCLQIFKN